MPPPTPCPDPRLFEFLRQGNLAPEEESALISHLDACASCRDLLDAQIAADGVPPGMSPSRGKAGPAPDDALARALASLRARPDFPPVGEGPGPYTSMSSEVTLVGNPEVPDPTEPDPAGSKARLTPRERECLEPSDDPQSLGRIGRYEVLGLVGRGGMGFVLKAQDPSLKRVVALKILAPALALDPLSRRRFSREAQAAAAVCHEHVVNIHAVEETGDFPYLVMQFVEGQSLQEKLDRVGPLGLKEILRIGMQVASGLAAAHAQGLVHRDIKPSNILLENSIERVKITDFGLARATDDGVLTELGTLAGTPSYMSPEQAGGEALDHRSDLFSLGSVLYAMGTGGPPFRAENPLTLLRKVIAEEPRPIRSRNPEIPGWLAAIVSRLMAKSPARRYDSAGEVADLLARRLAELQLPGTAGPFETADDREDARRTSRWKDSRILAVSLASLVLGAVLVLLLVGPRPRPAHEPVSHAPPRPIEPAEVDPDLVELDREIAFHPRDKEAYYRRGIALSEKKKYRRAVADFDKAIEIDPDFLDAYMRRGWAHNELGELANAIEDYSGVIRIDRKCSQAYDLRGRSRRGLRQWKLSLDDHSEAIGLSPNEWGFYYERALTYNDMSDWDNAVSDLKHALALDPGNAYALNELALTYRRMRELDRAIEFHDKAVAANTTNPGKYFERGITYQERKEWDRAITDFIEAYRLLTRDSPPRFASDIQVRLGVSCREKKDSKRAFKAFEEAIERDETNADAFEERAVTRERLGDADGAKQDREHAERLRRASRTKPGD